jgi:hypothetical protein
VSLEKFNKAVALHTLNELEQAKMLAFYNQTKGIAEFTREDLKRWFIEVGKSPNLSRLLTNLRKSKSFIRGSTPDKYRLHGATLDHLKAKFPSIGAKDKIDECVGELIPLEYYRGLRREYIKKIADQANWAYEAAAYDAAAVMMRRLLEILLIHSYKEKKIDGKIKNTDGHYIELDKIIGQVVNEPDINLSKGVFKSLNKCKDIGNLSAHDLVKTCEKDEIDDVKIQYRQVIKHLLDILNFSH